MDNGLISWANDLVRDIDQFIGGAVVTGAIVVLVLVYLKERTLRSVVLAGIVAAFVIYLVEQAGISDLAGLFGGTFE